MISSIEESFDKLIDGSFGRSIDGSWDRLVDGHLMNILFKRLLDKLVDSYIFIYYFNL